MLSGVNYRTRLGLLLLGFLAAVWLRPGRLEAAQQEAVIEQVRQGQDAIFRLDYSGAGAVFKRLIREHPNDPVGYGMDTTLALNQLLFEAKNLAVDDYATPTPFTRQPTAKPLDSERKRFLESVKRLTQVCDRRLAEKPQDTRALYFKGLGFEHLATEALVVRRDLGEARSYGKRAANLHRKVLSIDPGFVDAHVSISVQEFAAATLPWSLKWLAFLIGYRGDKDEALEKIELVARKGIYRRREAKVVLALLHAWKGDPNRSVAIFRALRKEFPENFLSDINLAAIHQLTLDDPTSALRVYQELLSNLSRKAPGINPGEVHYRIGKTQVLLGENSRALESFKKALETPQGEAETGPLANFSMAQIYETRGQSDQAKQHYRKVLAYKGPPQVLKDEIRKARKRVKSL